ncbi:hypothetical protein [Microcoleus sp.]|uniref:hypothetical protein n=1 Tax=Microcoleus sp. TaxID=44472 RepID=UPI00403EF374
MKHLFINNLSYSGSQESEVCPMPYALCPMHVGYLMLLRKAIGTNAIVHTRASM